MDPKIRFPELNKKSGVYYAVTDDGIELPVIDVTHPAFMVVDSPDLPQRIEAALAQWKKIERLPKFIRAIIMWNISRKSILMKGIRKASGTFLSGMSTYLAKLGADNLGAAYSGNSIKSFPRRFLITSCVNGFRNSPGSSQRRSISCLAQTPNRTSILSISPAALAATA